MIKIKPYEHTDRYKLEKLIKASYQENKMPSPEGKKIIDTIAFFTSFPQCGKILLITYNNNPIGYTLINYIWKLRNGEITYQIDEIFIDKDYRKFKPEINLVEHLIKQNKVKSIEIKLGKLKSISRRVLKFFKFERKFGPFFRKIIN